MESSPAAPPALVRSAEAVEDDPEAGASDLVASGFGPGDVLVGIAASGRTPYVLGAVAKARQMGALTCGISCTPDSELSRAVDYPIEPKPGPEILTGSTRMRAGTATKLVLNMISTAVMIRLGHVYGNLMVNVQPTNAQAGGSGAADHCKATGVDENARRGAAGAVRTQRRGPRSSWKRRRSAARKRNNCWPQARGRITEALK